MSPLIVVLGMEYILKGFEGGCYAERVQILPRVP